MTTLDDLRKRPHIAALAAGQLVYLYGGYDRPQVKARAEAAEVGMIAANLDTGIFWLPSERISEIHQGLCEEAGAENVSIMDDPYERTCLRCGANLADVMGVYIFVDRKPMPGLLLCVEHGAGMNGMSRERFDAMPRYGVNTPATNSEGAARSEQ